MKKLANRNPRRLATYGVSTIVFAASIIVLIVIAGVGYGLYFTKTTSGTSTSTYTTTTTRTISVTPSGSAYTVDIAYNSAIGYYLTNSTGFTLYFRSTDTPNSGNTTCNTAVCETNWPVFYQASLNLPPGLSSSQFSTITPYNTTKIVTYNGYALFYWAHDTKAGDVTGQGIGGFCVATVPVLKTPCTSTTTSTTTPSQGYSTQIGSSTSIGQYLENGTGFTLYMFANDSPGSGTSACTGACSAVWPAFYASSMKLPSGLNSSSFSTITRPDGTKQTTYNGWPLYYYAPDSSSGSMLGEGANQYGGLWYAMPPTMQQSGGQIIASASYSLGVAYKPSIGIYLTNSTGFTLYFRSTDTPNSGNTTCNTAVCETNWPVFYQASLNLPPGLSSSQFSTITPYNTTKIVTYNGYALFYWAHDTKAGDVTGQGIGNFYAATLPAPTVPTTTSTSSSTSTTTSSSYYYP